MYLSKKFFQVNGRKGRPRGCQSVMVISNRFIASAPNREINKMQLLNCWEIKKCGRQRSGKKVNELGECVASKEKVGHSCWAFAGTMCGDEIQGTYAKKIKFCTFCEVYEIYNRSRGNLGKVIKNFFSTEEKKYSNKILEFFDD